MSAHDVEKKRRVSRRHAQCGHHRLLRDGPSGDRGKACGGQPRGKANDSARFSLGRAEPPLQARLYSTPTRYFRQFSPQFAADLAAVSRAIEPTRTARWLPRGRVVGEVAADFAAMKSEPRLKTAPYL